MSTKWRRFEVLLPRRFNDGREVPAVWISEAVLEIADRFRGVSHETQHIQGHWRDGEIFYRDDLQRVIVDIPETRANRKWMTSFKARSALISSVDSRSVGSGSPRVTTPSRRSMAATCRSLRMGIDRTMLGMSRRLELRRLFRPLPVAALVATFAIAWAPDVRAEEQRARVARAPVPLDGVAAIVDDVILFRSEITARARHFESKLSRDPVKRRAELVDMKKQLLARLIDETLVAKEAAKLHIEATDAEVASGIESVAQANKINRKQLEAEVTKVGYTFAEYQEEIRHQLLEQKWLVLRVSGKIDRKKTPDAASFQAAMEKERELLLAELRSRAFIEVR